MNISEENKIIVKISYSPVTVDFGSSLHSYFAALLQNMRILFLILKQDGWHIQLKVGVHSASCAVSLLDS